MNWIPKPSPAMVVAIISLIVAIGGTAVALPGSNTVGRDDLKVDSVGARALGDTLVVTNGLASADPMAGDDQFTESQGTIRCPGKAPFAFDPAIGNMGPLAYEVNRKVIVNRFGSPGGYTFTVTTDLGEVGFTMTVNCLPRR
jgi:hypothetical protein